jgi:hypothetical protein
MFTSKFVHTDVAEVGELRLPEVTGTDAGTPDILNKIHHMVRYAQMSNLVREPIPLKLAHFLPILWPCTLPR